MRRGQSPPIVADVFVGRRCLPPRDTFGNDCSGDEICCQPLNPDAFGSALDRDLLALRAVGRFLSGRLIGREPGGKLHLVP